ncbi:Crp/Fnr family transcriptional regulator [Thermodesulfobacteriota bacterium]
MYLKQSDLFFGLGHNFLKETMAIAEKVPFEDGEFIFREGDPANYFYILIKGKISLILGDPAQVVYTTSGVGELFGCACLIGRDNYFLSAQCDKSSMLLRLDRQILNKILDNDTDNSILFFKNLAAALGNRLRQMYYTLALKTPTAMPD